MYGGGRIYKMDDNTRKSFGVGERERETKSMNYALYGFLGEVSQTDPK